MKILTWILLLATEFSLNFGEVNASGNRGASSQIRQPSGPNSAAHIEVVMYKGCFISLKLDASRTIVLEAATETRNDIPDRQYARSHNFITRCVYVGRFRLVVYTENEELIAVRVPGRNVPEGGYEPDIFTWYITYSSKIFKVEQKPITEEPVSITLLPENRHEGIPNCQKEWIAMGDIAFFVFRAPNGEIVGAELDRGSC